MLRPRLCRLVIEQFHGKAAPSLGNRPQLGGIAEHFRKRRHTVYDRKILKDVRFPKTTLRRVITDYTREAGVRQLEREIAALTRKATRKIVGNGHVKRPMVIEAAKVPDLLGAPKFVGEKSEAIKELGIATGLVWTPVGGEVVYIEATRMPGKGNLPP